MAEPAYKDILEVLADIQNSKEGGGGLKDPGEALRRIDSERVTGGSGADLVDADRYAQGANFSRYGAVGPVIATLLSGGYEGVYKPAQDALAKLGVGTGDSAAGFKEGVTSEAGDPLFGLLNGTMSDPRNQAALNRAGAVIQGAANQTSKDGALPDVPGIASDVKKLLTGDWNSF